MSNKNDKAASSASLTSAFKKTYGSFLKYAGVAGLTFFAYFTKTAHDTVLANPDATLLDFGSNFYGGAIDAAVNDFIPGTAFILKEVFNFAAAAVTDFVLPGVGTLWNSMELIP